MYENNNLEDTMKYYNNELDDINNKINKMNYILKELLARNGGHVEKESKGKIYSGVKQYIKGTLKADQLTKMKSFKKYDALSLENGIVKENTEFNKDKFTINNDTNMYSSLNIVYEPKKHSSKKNLDILKNYSNEESNEKLDNNKIHEVRDIQRRYYTYK